MFDATDAAARRSWVTSPYRSVEGNCFVARSEEHTSELQSLAYLVCRLIISEEHTSELQSLAYLVCRLLLEKKKKKINTAPASSAIRLKTEVDINNDYRWHIRPQPLSRVSQ